VVIWTPLAQADLKNIYHRIAKDAPLNAKKVSAEIVKHVDGVLSLPQDLGKKVPEFNRDDVREIHIHAWRIIYQVQEQKRVVIALFHKRRELAPTDISFGH
jgi:toxin ParE1/3/4